MIEYTTIFFISVTSFMAGAFTFFLIGYCKFYFQKKYEAKELSHIFRKIAEDMKVAEHSATRNHGAQA